MAVDLLQVADGHEEIWGDKEQGPVESRRRYSDDGEGMFVNQYRAAHHAAIVLEARVPVSIGEHDIGCARITMFIGGVEEAAKIRLNLQYVEIIRGRSKARGARWIVACVKPREYKVEGRQLFKAAVAVAQIEVVGIGLPACVGAVLGSIQILGVRHIQRAQDQA